MSGFITEAEDADLAAGVASLRDLMLATQEWRQAMAARLGLTLTDTIAMSNLAASGELTAGELAERLGLAASSVTALVDRLENAGYVTRRRGEDDRRAVTVVVTDAGLATHAYARHWMQNALLDLGADEVAAAARLLARLAESLRVQVQGVNTTAVPEAVVPLCAGE